MAPTSKEAPMAPLLGSGGGGEVGGGRTHSSAPAGVPLQPVFLVALRGARVSLGPSGG